MLFQFRKRYTLNYFCTEFSKINSLINLKRIGLLGGEPLLHPDITEIIKMTKKIFSNTEIIIITNGIMLDKMDEEFWKTCSKTRTKILISKFNIKLNKALIFKKIMQYKIQACFYGATGNEYKKMYHPALDLSGSQNKEEMHKRCWQNKGSCNYYEAGKLYKCTTVGNIETFNKFYNQNLEVTNNDYIDIYKVKNIAEIEKYFNNTIDFCKYCNINAEKQNLTWEVSKREMSDWLM